MIQHAYNTYNIYETLYKKKLWELQNYTDQDKDDVCFKTNCHNWKDTTVYRRCAAVTKKRNEHVRTLQGPGHNEMCVCVRASVPQSATAV